MTRIGFIGLGLMGKPMARNLLRAGFDLTVHNRSLAPVQELEAAGARVATSPREVAARCEVLYAAMLAAGQGGLDNLAVITVLEALAGVEVKQRQ